MNANDTENSESNTNSSAHSNNSTEILNQKINIIKLLRMKKYRHQLLCLSILSLSQNFSGILPVIFYSADIFTKLNLDENLIQYAIIFTGLTSMVSIMIRLKTVNKLDKLGRKNSLMFSKLLIIVSYCTVTLFVNVYFLN